MTEIVVDIDDGKPGPGRGGAQGLDPPRGRFGRRGDLVGVAEIHVADHVDDQQRGSRTRAWISRRSEEHTSELQSLMRISYAVFCWNNTQTTDTKSQKRLL